MIDVYKWAKENNVIRASAMPDLKNSADFLCNLEIENMVEIGTYFGVSAAWFVQFVDRVYTFDVADYLEKYKVWFELGVSNKISFYLIYGRQAKNFEKEIPKNEKAVDIKVILDKIQFDFAFIDGQHNYKDVKADFELVKNCGRVLLHDTDKVRFEGVNRFANEIGAKQIFDNVSYWETK